MPVTPSPGLPGLANNASPTSMDGLNMGLLGVNKCLYLGKKKIVQLSVLEQEKTFLGEKILWYIYFTLFVNISVTKPSSGH